MPHRISTTEYARLSTLYRYGVLDAPADPAIDAVLRDLAASLRVPVAQLMLADLQRFDAISSIGPARAEALRGGTLADLVVNDRATLALGDASAPDRIPGDLPPCDVPLLSYAAIRISSPEDEALGILQVADARPREFTSADTAAIEVAAHAASVLLESRRRACHDGETGALKRDSFADVVRRMVEAARRGRQRISLVHLGIGEFRTSLERMGTGLGRIALRRMADIGLRQVRRRDCFGRVGYDDFAVLLTDTGEAGARILAERLVQHLRQGWSETLPDTGPVAIEVASVKPTPGDDAATVLMRAADPQRSRPTPGALIGAA